MAIRIDRRAWLRITIVTPKNDGQVLPKLEVHLAHSSEPIDITVECDGEALLQLLRGRSQLGDGSCESARPTVGREYTELGRH